MAFVSTKKWDEMARKVKSAKGTLARYKEQAEKTAETVMVTAETTGSAFVASYARGRYADEDGRFEVAGIAPDLAAGVAFNIMGFAGALGQYDAHAHAVGNGLLSAYASYKGMEIGAQHASETGRRSASNQAARGALPPANAPLSTGGVDSALVQQIRNKLGVE